MTGRPDRDPVDAIVVGAGAAGAAVAWRLATRGASVACLEQGDWDRPEVVPHERPDWEVLRQRSRNPDPNLRALREDYPVNDDATPIRLSMYNAVGGSTIHWGAHFPRLRPSDFRVRTLDGIADDWPISYPELEPYFALNDELMGVSGIAGDPGNPPRGPRQTPPLPLGEGGVALAGAFDRLGWHWWPTDAAINSRPYGDGRGACNGCGPCDLGCPLRARASTDVTYWPRALAAGARLRTGARAYEVVLDGRGHARGVRYVDTDGHHHEQLADRVVLAANGVGTARLLLLSTPPGHPDGLANSSGLVGRRLMHHPTGMATGVFAEPLRGFRGPFAVSVLSQEFYETRPEHPFVRGYQMQHVRSDGPLGTALGGYLAPVPWGADHHRVFDARFGHTASLTVTTEDLPDPGNRVTLDPQLADSDGIPAPRVEYSVSDNTHAMIDHGLASATTALREAGADEVVTVGLVASAGFHLLGTARMGDDPATSVVDRDGHAHDVPGLHVADGAVFVTAGALNPTSTLQANALRTADRMLAASGARRPTAAAAAR